MVRRMLIDAAHPEEIRVVVIDGNRVEEFDFETSTKKQIKGNIYLAKVTRVEPSLQAAFVDYGGNRHGFLAFNEIHPDYYRIPVADRQALLAEPVPRDAPPERASRRRRHAERSDEPGAALPSEDETVTAGDQPSEPPAIDGPPPWFDTAHPAEIPPREEALAQPDHGPGLHPDTGRFAPLDEPEGEPKRDVGSEGAAHGLDVPPQALAETLLAPSHEDSEAAVAATAEDAPPADLGAPTDSPSEPPNAADEETEKEPPLESVGGDDDVDEVEQRRRYRFSRHYKIQEVVKRRQVMLIQAVKEERGTKGAALTTYLSLAGRYCVLMPNTARGGGISRRITSPGDRKRLKAIMDELEVPEGMAVILRTAGVERSKAEIKRDYEYLLRLWDEVRELTLRSTAPCLVYEEANLIKRAIRDLYSRDIDEILVEGEEAYKAARAFMKTLMPSHVGRIQLYRDPAVPLFQRFQVEQALDEIHSPTVRLRSGGYVVINPTEALVAIDVNSGRSTRERHIEETALKTNIEAADEIARQIRLRDLAGLIVIDFIDMEEHRNQQAVERRLKEAMKNDRARIQIGRISAFGLLELSRQRLRPSLVEVSSERCPHCAGSGYVRSTESTALHVLRGIEEEGSRQRASELTIFVASPVALYLLNQKRAAITGIESRYQVSVVVERDDALVPPAYRLERTKARTGPVEPFPALPVRPDLVEDVAEPIPAEAEPVVDHEPEPSLSPGEPAGAAEERAEGEEGHRRRRRRRRRRGGRGEDRGRDQRPSRDDDGASSAVEPSAPPAADSFEHDVYLPEDKEIGLLRGPGHEPGGPSEHIVEPVEGGAAEVETTDGRPEGERRRRRSRRGGRRRGRRDGGGQEAPSWGEQPPETPHAAEPPMAPGAPAAPELGLAVSATPAPAHDWPWNRPTETASQPTLPGIAEPSAPAEAQRAVETAPAAPVKPSVTIEPPAPVAAPVEPPHPVERPIETAPPEPVRPSVTIEPPAPAVAPPVEIAPAPAAAEAKPTAPAKRGWWRRLTNGG